MKFDRFLAKLFSRTMVITLIITLVLVLLLSSCVCTEEDCLLCFFCGCITPETTCNICDWVNNCLCNCACTCAENLPSGGANTDNCFILGCMRDCLTDENGDPVDCEDVGCPECQKYFECKDEC